MKENFTQQFVCRGENKLNDSACSVYALLSSYS